MANRSAAHNRAQMEGKKRDLYVCQICGSTINPEGHHIIDYQYGGAATAGNIITLCRNCHKQVHRNKIDLLEF